MRQYSSDKVKISWIGVPFEDGLSAGTFITFQDDKASWQWIPDGLGGGVRLPIADRSGIASVTMDVETIPYLVLLSLAASDRRTGALIGPLIMADINSGYTVICSSAYIEGDPNEQRATTSVNSVWNFRYTGRQSFAGLPNLNKIGK